MESQPQNPEFRNNPENFHPGLYDNFMRITAFTLKSFSNFGFSFSTSMIGSTDNQKCPIKSCTKIGLVAIPLTC